MRARRVVRYACYRFAPRLTAFGENLLRGSTNKPRVVDVPAASGRAIDGAERARVLETEAQQLRNALSATNSLDEMIAIVRGGKHIRSDQIPVEIRQLLEQLRQRKPACICEIGAAVGGTLALFARMGSPNAHILSIDLKLPIERQQAYQHLLHDNQTLTCIEGDSHSPEVIARVREWAAGRPFEFLFIDGDHTYEGVKADYDNFHDLVARDGIIAFHDIMPDFSTRYGVNSGSNAGGVPKFWKELAASKPRSKAFVEHRWQDGYGIGVLFN